jgi:cyclase
MRRIRVIPTLLLQQKRLVKTRQFKQEKYVGDPINTVKILNEKEVDELVILDIAATRDQTDPDIEAIAEIASECFMPLAYGGGITRFEQAKSIFDVGVEKVILNSAFFNNPTLVREIADVFGSQSVVVSIDVKLNRFFGGYRVFTQGGSVKAGLDPVAAAIRAQESGAGEILLTSIDRDGVQSGYDVSLTKSVAEAVDIPVIASGGAGSTDDFVAAIQQGKASAVAAGAMFVFKGPHRAVLVSYPAPNVLRSQVFEKL